ncbi:MAG: methyltransferase domain-containing protein [Chloroflexi bacterium]|nr:MAG: methyltransferase domain-containing protein [Chloroflexota bacterium]
MAAISKGAPHPKVDGMPRAIWRRLLRWRFLLVQRRRYNRLALDRVDGHPIVLLPGVFHPRLFRTGEFLAEALDEALIPPGSTVLDMGTGSGVGALSAARLAHRVVAVDINPAAVRCARINVLLNELEERIEVCRGDLFGPLAGERFDVVLFNPPFFPGVPRDDLERALWSTDVAARFAAGLPQHLAPGGCALVLLSSDGDEPSFLDAFRLNGLVVDVAVRRSFATETLTIYRVARRAGETP